VITVLEIIAGMIIVLIGFLTTVLLIPSYIKKARGINMVGTDMNKYDKPKIPDGGGITFIFGSLAAVFFYVFLKVFYFGTKDNLTLIFAITITLLLAGFLGFIDDILGWKVGIKRWKKVLLTIPIGVPLMVMNAGESFMDIPLIGVVDFGIVYPLVIVPLGIILAANGFNMLAGYNGMEAGLGIIILSTLGFVSWYVNGIVWLALMSFIFAGSLFGFLIFNWYPARIFPGDSLTYSVGALIAIIAIVGSMEKIGVILFIPFIADAVLSLLPEVRGKGKVEAFAKVNKDNSLEMPYKKIHDVTHFAIFSLKRIKRKVYERDVTLFIYLLEVIMVALVFIFFIGV